MKFACFARIEPIAAIDAYDSINLTTYFKVSIYGNFIYDAYMIVHITSFGGVWHLAFLTQTSTPVKLNTSIMFSQAHRIILVADNISLCRAFTNVLPLPRAAVQALTSSLNSPLLNRPST